MRYEACSGSIQNITKIMKTNSSSEARRAAGTKPSTARNFGCAFRNLDTFIS